MDIINDITRVARESKRIIEEQQREIEKLKIENEAYKLAFSNMPQRGVTTVEGSGIGKYFDDGKLTIEVTSLMPNEVAYDNWKQISNVPHGTPIYIVDIELNAKYVQHKQRLFL